MIPLHDDNPTEITPIVTVSFMVACVLVFFWQISLDELAQQRAVFSFGVIPAVLFDIKQLAPDLAVLPAELTVFSSMFLHGGWMHLIGNMLYLWIFGNNVEDAMGHLRFIAFYFLSGIGAALAQSLANPESTIPMIGASGAISGILGAYILLYPHARVLVAIPLGFFFYTLRLPALAVLGFWFVLQLINSALTSSDEGGVAFIAHAGGFVVGMALVPIMKRRGVRLFNPARGGQL
ncbi:MAG: rhomboid family intramembrane serine protease [Gammaproteobacteria bacterium]